jgi:methanogenic corrinoid protein MtbC1
VTPFDRLEALSTALIELDEEATLDLTRRLLAGGCASQIAIVQSCQRAMVVVGERYEKREYFLSGLIVAGEIFKGVLDLLEPHKERMPTPAHAGTVVLGTVAGDIHDIGKNMFASALRTFGFTVIDLGVDVSPVRFLEEVKRSTPDVLCLSGLVSSAFDSMKKTVGLLRADSGHFDSVPPVVIGGATIDDEVCRFAGADSWSTDAMEGVRICERLVATKGAQDQ